MLTRQRREHCRVQTVIEDQTRPLELFSSGFLLRGRRRRSRRIAFEDGHLSDWGARPLLESETMPIYQHRQRGTLTIALLGIAIAICGAIAFRSTGTEVMIAVGAIAFILLLLAILFGSLSVKVDTDEIVLWFGPGLIKKRLQVSDIQAVRSVRNRWYYGWGIRLTPHGWLYNVSGLDAVELEYHNGKKFRIGSDDVKNLRATIETVIQGSTAGTSPE